MKTPQPADAETVAAASRPPASAPPAVFDLADIEAVDADWMEVLKNGRKTGWSIQLAGPTHPETLAVQREALAARLAKDRRIEMAQVNRKKYVGEDVDADAETGRFAAQLARRILGWGPVTVNGVDFPYSRANALALMSEPRWTFVQSQVVDFFTADSAFSKSSAPT